MSFAELFPPLAKGALIGTIDDPHWRKMWDMASADSFAMAAELQGGQRLRTGQALIDAMQSSPHKEVEIEPARMPMPVRDIEF